MVCTRTRHTLRGGGGGGGGGGGVVPTLPSGLFNLEHVIIPSGLPFCPLSGVK